MMIWEALAGYMVAQLGAFLDSRTATFCFALTICLAYGLLFPLRSLWQALFQDCYRLLDHVVDYLLSRPSPVQ